MNMKNESPAESPTAAVLLISLSLSRFERWWVEDRGPIVLGPKWWLVVLRLVVVWMLSVGEEGVAEFVNELDADHTAGKVEILGAAVFSSGSGATADIAAPPLAVVWMFSVVNEQDVDHGVGSVGHAPRSVERTRMPVFVIVTGAAVQTGASTSVLCAIVEEIR